MIRLWRYWLSAPETILNGLDNVAPAASNTKAPALRNPLRSLLALSEGYRPTRSANRL